LTVQKVEETGDRRHRCTRGPDDKLEAALKIVSPPGDRRETTTTTTKFECQSPEVSTAGSMNAAAVAAAAAAALSHQRMMMSPLPFDRVSSC